MEVVREDKEQRKGREFDDGEVWKRVRREGVYMVELIEDEDRTIFILFPFLFFYFFIYFLFLKSKYDFFYGVRMS